MDGGDPTAGFPCVRLSEWCAAATMTQTVHRNMEGFALGEAKKADLARGVQM